MLVSKLLKILIILLVLDVITTHIALNYGTEQNLILVSFSGLLNLSVLAIVYLTHILAVGLIVLVYNLINKDNIKVHKISYIPIFGALGLYAFIVVNNMAQLLKIIS